MELTPPLHRRNDRIFFVANAVVSAAALALLTYLLVLRGGGGAVGANVRALPALNASLNGLAALLLLGGFFAIRRRAIQLHRTLMIAAFCASALFLVSYLTYHYLHGDTHYAGPEALRLPYYLVLASHVALSIAVVPLALTAFYFAFGGSFQRHKRVTRILWPIWMYVSVTGVAVFFLLRSSY
jgi:putative membrane protein